MGWMIFWAITIVYWVVAVKRIPLYYKRVDEHHAKEYPYGYAEGRYTKDNAWGAFGLAAFWPIYEAGRWLQNHIINVSTADERKEAEYRKAAQIVEDYKLQQEKAEREEFDKQLRGDK